MRNENDTPGLIPFDDKHPSPRDLYRRPEDLSDDQFALLAATWSEGAMSDEQLLEFESVIEGNPERKAIALDFKNIRLIPGNEKWNGKSAQLKPESSSLFTRRVMYASMASAAAFTVIFALSPLLKKSVQQSSPAILPSIEITAVMPGPAVSSPAAPDHPPTVKKIPENTSLNTVVPAQTERIKISRTSPLSVTGSPEEARLLAVVDASELRSVKMNQIHFESQNDPGESNWVMKGLKALSAAVAKNDKPVDGYHIAGAFVNGINSFLGWEMELDRVSSDEGTPLAVNFNSSLLSFSSPVKKNLREQ